MIDPATIRSTTPAKYLFQLISPTETIICDPEPIEWASGELEFSRDLDAGGVISSFSLDSLTFVGNGALMLKKLYDAYELNAQCTLVIYWWKNFDPITPANGRRYVEFPSRYDINFNFFEIAQVGKFFYGVRVKAVNSSMQTKLTNREDVKVNITQLASIGSIDVNIADYYPPFKSGLFYAATNDNYNAYLYLNTAFAGCNLAHLNGTESFTSVPLVVQNSDGDFGTQVRSTKYVTQIPITSLSQLPSFFENALYDYDLTIYFEFIINIITPYSPLFGGGSDPWNIQILVTEWSGSPIGVQHETIITTYDLGDFGRTEGIYQTPKNAGTVSVHIEKGQNLKLVVHAPGIHGVYRSILLSSWIQFTQVVASTPATLTSGIPLYEAFERTLQLITDQQYPFYSEFFARTDVYKNANKEFYASENQLRFAHIQSGLNQRGVSIFDANSPLSLNFKDLFATVKAIYNVGYSFEINPALFGDPNQRVRIEEYSHFFQNTLILDLSARIKEYDINSVAMPELVPVDIKSGFNSYEYLSLNGRSEPNTTYERTSIMNTPTKLEIISPLRGDTKGIINNLNTPVIAGSGTTDTKGESDIYIVKTQKCTDGIYGHDWIPERAENITIEQNSSLFGEDLLNRYFTPTRMLMRFGNRIKAGMTKYLNSYLRFQVSDKYCSLITSGEGYTNPITENQDINVSDLPDPIYKPVKHMVNVKFTFADLELIQANPFGLIKFSDNIEGYLLNLKKKNREDKAEISIIEKY